MSSGKFLNCYGLKDLNLPSIDFTTSNKAIIYAPNGVMKTSFSKVMDDISKGIAPMDEFLAILRKYSIPFEQQNGTYIIYGYL